MKIYFWSNFQIFFQYRLFKHQTWVNAFFLKMNQKHPYFISDILLHMHLLKRMSLQYYKKGKHNWDTCFKLIILILINAWLITDAPVCRSDDVTVVGASLDEVLRVRCHVTADPADVTFVWQFNNSGESFEVSQSRYGTGNGSTSELNYTPKSDRDYGTLACWGKNAIGLQAKDGPCIFQIVPAGMFITLFNFIELTWL